MCGIAGRFNFDPSHTVSRAGLVAMTDAVIDRGPDAGGYYLDGAIGLGHRRLSIIDLATGDQPMCNEDGRCGSSSTARSTTSPSSARELDRERPPLPTHTDTEDDRARLRGMGRDCVDRFRGMFAFAFWDRTQRRLLLARDRLGVKPLYYAAGRAGIVFGSEIKVLLEDPTDRVSGARSRSTPI